MTFYEKHFYRFPKELQKEYLKESENYKNILSGLNIKYNNYDFKGKEKIVIMKIINSRYETINKIRSDLNFNPPILFEIEMEKPTRNYAWLSPPRRLNTQKKVLEYLIAETIFLQLKISQEDFNIILDDLYDEDEESAFKETF